MAAVPATTSAKAPGPGDIRSEILRQVAVRGADKSICPSEVARAYGDDWQRLMPHVRNAARSLSRDGLIDILRKGRPVDPEAMKGVIRLRLRIGGAAEATPTEADPAGSPVIPDE